MATRQLYEHGILVALKASYPVTIYSGLFAIHAALRRSLTSPAGDHQRSWHRRGPTSGGLLVACKAAWPPDLWHGSSHKVASCCSSVLCGSAPESVAASWRVPHKNPCLHGSPQ